MGGDKDEIMIFFDLLFGFRARLYRGAGEFGARDGRACPVAPRSRCASGDGHPPHKEGSGPSRVSASGITGATEGREI